MCCWHASALICTHFAVTEGRREPQQPLCGLSLLRFAEASTAVLCVQPLAVYNYARTTVELVGSSGTRWRTDSDRPYLEYLEYPGCIGLKVQKAWTSRARPASRHLVIFRLAARDPPPLRRELK